MIGLAERRRRAREMGVQESAIERDFVLSCLLAAYGADPGSFVFRGGTALARTYWPDHRLSEDLDLIAATTVPDLARWMTDLVDASAELVGAPLDLRFTGPKGGWSRSFVDWSDGSLVVDVNLDERIALPVESQRLDLPYEQLRNEERSVPTVSLAEILGNKWFMIEDRTEPRDLFDVWWAVSQAGVPFATIAAGHRAKYRYPPVRQVLSGAETRMRSAWEERLAHQLRDLPDFGSALADVAASYDGWDRIGRP